MRFFLTFILILYASSSYAITLSRIPVDRLANKIKTITSPNNVLAPTTFALNSSDSLNALGHLLTIPIYAYNPALGIASSFALGYAGQANLKVKELYNEGKITDPALQALCDMIWPSPSNTGTIAAGTVISTPSGPYRIVSGPNDYAAKKSFADLTAQFSPALGYVPIGGLSADKQWIFRPAEDGGYGSLMGWPGNQYNTSYFYAASYNLEPAPGAQVSEGAPVQLNDSQASQLVDKIVEQQNEPGVRDSVNNLIKNNPDYAQYPDNISYNDINNYYTTNNQTVNNEYISNLQNLVNQYPDNPQLQQELAKAEAETFDAIPVDAFDPSYNPGQFDIPARFTAFLNNVKTSGLFSFSSDFFESLPGDGSPIYQINGGETFGIHTIDLSDTLSGGLAVLKTVLLVCFGFLSIRAVIMKR
jgi:hypothetical protein